MERENIRDWNYYQDGHMQNELESNGVFRFSSLSMDHSEKEFEDFFSSNGGLLQLEIKNEPCSAFLNELEGQSEEFSLFGGVYAPDHHSEVHNGPHQLQSPEPLAHQHGCEDACTCLETEEGAQTEDSGVADQPIVIKVTREAQEQLFSSYEELVDFNPHGLLEENEYCSCAKSKCVLMYCSCFRRGLPCSKLCRCEDCENKPEHYQQSALLRQQKLANGASYYISSVDELFCTCRTSFCQKLYCPCKKNQRACTDRCRCFACKNCFGSRPGPNKH